eukprot:maker-scaffold_10-snap-gene-4.18-mRNA-1 protein AED:0.02 eAED:0.02 QI:112/1/1/1/1/1/3/244/463
MKLLKICLSLLLIVNGKLSNSDPSSKTPLQRELCDPVDLLDFNHFVGIPRIERLQNTRAVKFEDEYNFCRFESKKGCCEQNHLSQLKAAFLNLDLQLKFFQEAIEHFWNNQDDFLFILEGFLETHFSIPRISSRLRKLLKSGMELEHQNLLKQTIEEGLDLLNDVLGYLSALSCSVCDLRSSEYIGYTRVSDSNEYGIQLTLRQGTEDLLGTRFFSVLQKMKILLSSQKLGKIFKQTVKEMCLIEANGDAKKKSSCENEKWWDEMYTTLKSSYLSGSRFFEFICTNPGMDLTGKETKDLCSDAFSKEFLRGLALHGDFFRRNLMKNLKANDKGYCPEKFLHCDNIIKYLNNSNWNKFNVNGEDGSKKKMPFNKYSTSSQSLDVVKVGKESKLSSRAFQSVHGQFSRHPEGTGFSFSGFLFGVIKFLFICSLLVGLAAAANFGYERWKERDLYSGFGDYSVLQG